MTIGCLPILIRTLHVLGPQGSYETLLKMQERADIQKGSLHIRNQAPPPAPRHRSGTRIEASQPPPPRPRQHPGRHNASIRRAGINDKPTPAIPPGQLE